MKDVVLVSMPFGPEMSPSLGLSLLKAGLEARGIPAEVLYFTLRFAERVGVGFYSRVATDGSRSVRELLGEWIFRPALFGAAPRDDARYVDEVLTRRTPWGGRGRPLPRSLVTRAFAARERVEPFLRDCLSAVLARRPRVVGFTSVFQQHVASLALARRLKTARPSTHVVFGGANCEGVMGAETLRRFPFVDSVVSGEGDVVFPELVGRVLAGRPLRGLQGVRSRETLDEETAAASFPNAASPARMDDLPEPDFSDYFAQFGRSRLAREWTPGLFLETSRGCWWGERSHCTFCGLNGASMRYRSKSAQRALDELTRIAGRHPGCDVQVVDNILDSGYFRTFLPALAKRGLGVPLFYETKSSLKKDEVRLLAEAGVTRIQPGIESLSDPVLRLMRKGVTALQNVQLLKWCAELGVKPYWNFLWGFPGEPPEEYPRMARVVELLTHLTPPEGLSGLRLDRFSPYFQEPARFGLTDIAPLDSYRHVYPLPDEALENLATYFGFSHADGRDPLGYAGPLLDAVGSWRRVFPRSALFSVDLGDSLLVWDLRPARRRPVSLLDATRRGLLLACDAATSRRSLAEVASADSSGAAGAAASEARLDEALGELVEDGLLLRDGERYLSLVVPLSERSPSGPALTRFWDVARSMGRATSRGLVIRLDEAARRPVPVRSSARSRSRRALRPEAARPSLQLTTSRFSVHPNGELVVN